MIIEIFIIVFVVVELKSERASSKQIRISGL
jgi:hypothetical protein